MQQWRAQGKFDTPLQIIEEMLVNLSYTEILIGRAGNESKLSRCRDRKDARTQG